MKTFNYPNKREERSYDNPFLLVYVDKGGHWNAILFESEADRGSAARHYQGYGAKVAVTMNLNEILDELVGR